MPVMKKTTRILILRHVKMMIIWIKNNLFVDKDEGDDNASSDKDVPTENRLQVPQNVVHCSSLQ